MNILAFRSKNFKKVSFLAKFLRFSIFNSLGIQKRSGFGFGRFVLMGVWPTWWFPRSSSTQIAQCLRIFFKIYYTALCSKVTQFFRSSNRHLPIVMCLREVSAVFKVDENIFIHGHRMAGYTRITTKTLRSCWLIRIITTKK